VAEALKTFFNPTIVRRLAADIAGVHPSFPSQAFIRDATRGLNRLELLDRGRQIARALAVHLPPDYPDAIDVLLRSLGQELVSDELLGAGMAPFYYLPHVIFVAEQGLDHFDLSMRAQHELTRRFSAEFSIRFFIAKDPDRTLAVLREWTTDPNAHVRRLVSEGTRLRLPWAMRVRWLDEHPARVLDLLDRLKDDPSSMVRRSVANSLNDLARVHPARAIETCAAWLEDASPERRALVTHALRSLVKQGNKDALRLLGYGRRAAVAIERVRITPKRVAIGGKVMVAFVIRNPTRRPQDVLVDLAVHFVKANGRASPKVFKVARLTLSPRGETALQTPVSLAVHTTRKPRPGVHAVDIVVNGDRRRAGSFMVR
jgi:3-methyladenine DNA glycosylase AlkC